MRAFTIAVLAWSGAALALDLPTPPANVVVEQVTCDTVMSGEILNSKKEAVKTIDSPTKFEGKSCTWYIGSTEYYLSVGTRTGASTAMVTTKSRREVSTVGNRESDSATREVIASGAGAVAGVYNTNEQSTYQINGASKMLVERQTNGARVDVTEVTTSRDEADLKILTTETRQSTPVTYSNSGDQANVTLSTRVCKIKRLAEPCEITQ